MWWGLIFGLLFAAPVIEAVEDWRLQRGVQKDLTEMRKHVASGDQWDVTRGQWIMPQREQRTESADRPMS
jgi:hypothetical protein